MRGTGSEVRCVIHTRDNALVKEAMQLRILCPKSLTLLPSIRRVPRTTQPWYNECAVSASIHIISLPSLHLNRGQLKR